MYRCTNNKLINYWQRAGNRGALPPQVLSF